MLPILPGRDSPEIPVVPAFNIFTKTALTHVFNGEHSIGGLAIAA